MDNLRKRAAIAAAVFACVAAMPVWSQTKSAQQMQDEKMAQIPTCTKRLGTLAVEEPERGTDWWSQRQLPSPTKLIKVFVAKSNCFTLVDRGAGMAMAMRERELASGGELRGQSNVGKGQVKAADYILVLDLLANNKDVGGTSVGRALGGLLGGSKFGRIAGAVNLHSKSADVSLTLTDVRSSEQVALAEGSAKKTDIGFGASGSLFGGGGFGGADVGGYANTTDGQVITLAYLQAYNKLVDQLGQLSSQPADTAQQAVTVTRASRLLANAAGTGKPVRSLDPGMMLYPTGNKQGVMWEVQDELGNKGWVSSEAVQLSR